MSDDSGRSRRNHLIALLATVLFHAAVVVVLLTLYLRYPGSERNERTWPPVDSSEVLFGGEYVMVGDRQEIAQSSDEPAPAEAEAQEKFGYLLDAFKYGVPPHGGLAFGLDRLVTLVLGLEDIRDVIAFPKVQNASELMTKCPSEPDPNALSELGIAVVSEE